MSNQPDCFIDPADLEALGWGNHVQTTLYRSGSGLVPLYTAESVRQILSDLVRVSTGSVGHLFNGLCPSVASDESSRDSDCPACQILVRAAEWNV